MTRAILENLFLFFLPTFLYLGWYIIRNPKSLKRGTDGHIKVLRIVHDAPLLWLGIAGALFMTIVLMSFGSSSGGKPGQYYHPPMYKDGQIIRGNIE